MAHAMNGFPGFVDTEAFEALANEFAPPPPKDPRPRLSLADRYKRYNPQLNRTQALIVASPAKYILAHGERFSGKTIGALYKLAKHCFEHNNALAIIVVGIKRQAEEGGAWYKLLNKILPQMEAALGYDHQKNPLYTDPKTNTAKDIFIWMQNIKGGFSRILLLSMPVEGFVKDRVKGMEPSFIFVDEAQTLESDTYFADIVQQLGRREGIPGSQQQIVYGANPEGPSHWLYKRFFEYPVDEKTGLWNPAYAHFHVPIEENIKNIPEGYWENVKEAVRGDPVEEARMLRGEWVDRPTGDALFGEDFVESLHIKGSVAKKIGIHPIKGHPIIVSYDLGAAHTSIHFTQIVPTKDKVWKIVFDEMDYVGQYIRYSKLVPEIIARMDYWNKKVGVTFRFIHISDNSAFNQYRAKDGSFDAWDIEKISEGKIRLRECPKGPHSVEARVRLFKDGLQQNEVLISASCPYTKKMVLGLEEDEKDRLKPKRSVHIHRFDSCTYGFFYFTMRRGRGMEAVDPAPIVPQIYVAGTS